jgi:uncharacterized damage-inducible protein DinB
MTAQEARAHIRYYGWASRKALEATLALSPEDRAKSMSVSHESIAKTLTPIYFADAIWYSRIAAASDPVPSHDALPSLDFVIGNGLARRQSGKPGPTQPRTPTLAGRRPSNPLRR